MSQVLVVEPVFAARLWGGDTLRSWYGDRVPTGTPIGECWAISGMPGSTGLISRGAPEGFTLADAWRAGLVTGSPREDDFPLLCKLLDTRDWLSVQVHPDDSQALELEGQRRGKSECWLVLAADPNAELIVGHSAGSAAEMANSLADGTMFSRLIRRHVEPGAFFMVPAGCVHALGPGLLVYEVQQSSDTTYRMYDFNRIGLDGKPRELNVQKAFSVMSIPFDPLSSLTAAAPELAPWGSRQELVRNDKFEVSRLAICDAMPLDSPAYQLVTVISGSGEVGDGPDRFPVTRGTSFVVVNGSRDVWLSGDLAVVVTKPGRATAT